MFEGSGVKGNAALNKVLPNPSCCLHQHLYHRAPDLMSALTTCTQTLRYVLQSMEIYMKKSFTSPEVLSEPPKTQDDSINIMQ